MAATIRDTAPRKRNVASLVGGVVIAVGCFVLWVLVAGELTQWPPSLGVVAAGVVVALGVGAGSAWLTFRWTVCRVIWFRRRR